MNVTDYRVRLPAFCLLEREQMRRAAEPCVVRRNQLAGEMVNLGLTALIGRNAGVGHIKAFRHRARLPEHIYRNAAARIPIAANA